MAKVNRILYKAGWLALVGLVTIPQLVLSVVLVVGITVQRTVNRFLLWLMPTDWRVWLVMRRMERLLKTLKENGDAQ